jgi:hypothetical protein
MSLPEIPSQPGEKLRSIADEMIANSYKVGEELAERALTSTTKPFHVHIYAWPVQEGDSFHVTVGGYWHVADELGIVNHNFGEEMPRWQNAGPASTACTSPASPEEPDGGVTASTS